MFSNLIISLSKSLHILATIVWIGGMFFAYMALRPAAAATLDLAPRLKLWANTFARFFPWIFICIIALIATGTLLLFGYKLGILRWHTHVMISLGVIMMLIFFHVYFAPYKRLRKAIAIEDWQQGSKYLAQIRVLVGINLSIGLILVLVVIAGGMW